VASLGEGGPRADIRSRNPSRTHDTIPGVLKLRFGVEEAVSALGALVDTLDAVRTRTVFERATYLVEGVPVDLSVVPTPATSER
jgi:hypothetical protein